MHGRGVHFPAARQVAWEDVSFDPARLGPTEVLIETHYTLISAGTEVAIYSGLEAGLVSFPCRPGYTHIGRVTHLGSDVKGIQAGDLLFSYAHHVSHTVLDTSRVFFLKVPDGLDIKTALFVRLAAVSITAPTIASFTLGDWVVVFGLGLVGNLAAQLFQLAGASVIGVDLADRRLEAAGRCGIAHTVNPRRHDVKEVVMTLTSGRGTDLVIDAIGSTECVMTGLDLLRRGGQILLIGLVREPSSHLASEVLRQVFLKWATIKSSWEWQIPQRGSEQVRTSIESNSHVLFGMLQDGRLRVADLISHTIRPDQIQDAYEGLLNRKDEYWGVVIDWTGT